MNKNKLKKYEKMINQICNYYHKRNYKTVELKVIKDIAYVGLLVGLKKLKKGSKKQKQSYLRKKIKGAVLCFLRKRQKISNKEKQFPDMDFFPYSIENIPYDVLVKTEIISGVQTMLNKLEPIEKTVIEMHFYEEKTIKQIRKEMGKPVMSIYRKAKKKIKEYYKEKNET